MSFSEFFSRGSLQETKYWLKRALSRNLLQVNEFNDLMDGLNNLAPQLNSFISSKRKI